MPGRYFVTPASTYLRFCWYKLTPDFHGTAHIYARRPAPVEHAPPHLRCYNLPKTFFLCRDEADKVMKETAKDRKERVEKYTESVKKEEETKLIIGMKKSFPFGSSLRDAMQTLELA
eukprot:821097-Rhodomonas_salina.1